MGQVHIFVTLNPFFTIVSHPMIKKYLGKLTSFIVLVGASLGANAQNSAKPFGVELNAGFREYLGDLGSSVFFQRKPIYNGVGGTFSYYLSPWFDVVLSSSVGDVGFYQVVEPLPAPIKYAGFRANIAEATLGLRLRLNNGVIFSEDSKFTPFIQAGWGGFYVDSRINNRTPHLIDFGATIQGGIGLQYQFNETWGVRLTSMANYTMNDIWDGAAGGPQEVLVHRLYRTNDLYMYNSFGITFSFGQGTGGGGEKRMKDKDMDGVPDKYDLCKNTPQQYRNYVDSNGCPLDTDKDSILDADDACPTVWGPRKFNGCPDTDKDGIEDKFDECPTQPGPVEFNGCPDSDGDGVRDKDDQCPEVKGLKSFNGCPDSDGDGIEDRKDKCPSKPGTVEGEGCPDSDGDGVYDHLDVCVDKAGTIANKGCPEIKAEVRAQIALAAKGINFETNSDVIKATSFTNLDNLVKLLNQYPEAKVEIQGHTDNSGTPEKNKDLSQRRADAVKKYLQEHGIDATRLTSVGYGQDKPIAPNTTAAGKAQNRRVDFVLSY